MRLASDRILIQYMCECIHVPFLHILFGSMPRPASSLTLYLLSYSFAGGRCVLQRRQGSRAHAHVNLNHQLAPLGGGLHQTADCRASDRIGSERIGSDQIGIASALRVNGDSVFKGKERKKERKKESKARSTIIRVIHCMHAHHQD